MCQWALISWPVKNKTPNSFYIFLGEVENKDPDILSDFYKDLQYLYPFYYSDKKNIYNIEDIVFFRRKYNLTKEITLVGKPNNDIIVFRTPVLYDISCMVPLFNQKKKTCYVEKNNTIGITVSTIDPIKRGKMLEQAMLYGCKNFIVFGGIYGSNKNRTSSLATRYLLSCKVPFSQIIKLQEDNGIKSVLNAFDTINFMFTDNIKEVVIVCSSENIQSIAKGIRTWKKIGAIKRNVKITYLCAF